MSSFEDLPTDDPILDEVDNSKNPTGEEAHLEIGDESEPEDD